MKRIVYIFAFLAVVLNSCSKDNSPPMGSFPTETSKHTINSTANMTFDPAELSAKVGDTIVFVVTSGHTVTSVDVAAWNANTSTPNDNFDYGVGTHERVLTAADVGTIYYVCSLHVSMGMKGKITVVLP